MAQVSDYIAEYYGQNYNCAETVFLSAVKAWGLNVPEDALKTMAGFGGGLGVGLVCGAVSGAVAAMGFRYCEGVGGHTSPELRKRASAFIKAAQAELTDINCAYLRKIYANPEERCLPTIRKITEILDRMEPPAE